ncbi:MAG: citrate/2-methylcitrate synthase [Candidatus Hodarchaeales archaeon]
MLPDIFYPEEISDSEYGPKGVTIISRSGAILYHLSDALASVGIAQNAVFGIGGDGAIGTRFIDIVPIVQKYPNTDLVVIAGEIGGCQEELIAEDILSHPEKYPKPIVALISGAKAPEGKTMGHAGAIVTPGQEYGTFKAKKEALEKAGVTVVNSQHGLINTVKRELHGRKYFQLERYRKKMTKTWEEPPKKAMTKTWEEPPKKAEWSTLITKVEPNNLIIAGYPLKNIIAKKSILETAHLLVKGEFPEKGILQELEKIAMKAINLPVPDIKVESKEDVSKTIAKYLLLDAEIAAYPEKGRNGPVFKTAFSLGRIAKYMANIFGNDGLLIETAVDQSFSCAVYAALTGNPADDDKKVNLLESMIVASVDHGVTPPSAQATVIAATVRAPYEVAIAHGVGAITDVHGGAGAKAAEFFLKCIQRSKESGKSLMEAVQEVMTGYVKSGKRIQGLGHRIHTSDPRREELWNKAVQSGIAGDCVEISKMVTDVFKRVRGITLPINVDGVIGAIIADMGLPVNIAKAVFIFGRVAGLSAHYYEEIFSQPQMRRINFANAVYKGKLGRTIL